MSAVTHPSTLRVAALQLGAPFGEAEANRERLVKAIEEMDEDLDLVVAPELVITGYNLEGFQRIGRELAEPVEGPTVAALRPLAADHGAVLMAGILEAGDDGSIYDTVVRCSRMVWSLPTGSPICTRWRRDISPPVTS